MKSKLQWEFEHQERLLEDLKAKIKALEEVAPVDWEAQKGYIATSSCTNPCGEQDTTGYDFHVLTEDEIVHRISGDGQDDGDWEVVNPEEFLHNLLVDAEEILASMKEELDT